METVYSYWYMTEFSGEIYQLESANPVYRNTLIAIHRNHEESYGWAITRSEDYRIFNTLEEARDVQNEERLIKPYDGEEYRRKYPSIYIPLKDRPKAKPRDPSGVARKPANVCSDHSKVSMCVGSLPVGTMWKGRRLDRLMFLYADGHEDYGKEVVFCKLVSRFGVFLWAEEGGV